MLSSPHEIIKFKRVCGFSVEEILALSRPTTNATNTVRRNFNKTLHIDRMTENKYKFTVQTSNNGTLDIPLTEGKALFV